MIANRIASVCFFSLIITLAVSCSTTSETTTEETTLSDEEREIPSWYNNTRSLQRDDTTFYSFATALASDSAQSVQKAGSRAKAELRSGVSSRLESIRNDAVVELGSDSGLDSPKFIIALRNAETRLGSVAEITEVEVNQNDNEIFRAFAKATVDKETLIEELDKALSANGNTWNAMKNSQAFNQF